MIRTGIFRLGNYSPTFSNTSMLVFLERLICRQQLVLIVLFWRGCMPLLMHLVHMNNLLLHLSMILVLLSLHQTYMSLCWTKWAHFLLVKPPLMLFSREFFQTRMNFVPLRGSLEPTKMRSRTLWPMFIVPITIFRTTMTTCIPNMGGHFLSLLDALILCLLVVLLLISGLHQPHLLEFINKLMIHYSSMMRSNLAPPLISIGSDIFLSPFFLMLTKRGRSMNWRD